MQVLGNCYSTSTSTYVSSSIPRERNADGWPGTDYLINVSKSICVIYIQDFGLWFVPVTDSTGLNTVFVCITAGV